MCGFAKQMIRVLGIAVVMAAPAAADQFSIGFSFGQGRGGNEIGLGFSWADRPVVARPVVVAPVVAQPVWVPTVQTTYRDVPVYDIWGQVVSYRREAVQVQSGYWATAPQPTVATGWSNGYGYNTCSDRNGWNGGGNWNKGHDEWRDRDDHRGGGVELRRYPAAASVHPVKVVRDRGR